MRVKHLDFSLLSWSEEFGHDPARQPAYGIEARCHTVSGQPVWAANPLRCGEAAAEPLTDDSTHFFGLSRSVA